jgi:hypothetical protein
MSEKRVFVFLRIFFWIKMRKQTRGKMIGRTEGAKKKRPELTGRMRESKTLLYAFFNSAMYNPTQNCSLLELSISTTAIEALPGEVLSDLS